MTIFVVVILVTYNEFLVMNEELEIYNRLSLAFIVGIYFLSIKMILTNLKN